jgi:hypothetical protein
MLLPTSDPNARAAALDAAWESLQDRTGFPREAFDAAARDAVVRPIQIEGKIVGALISIGPEIHACVKPAGFGRWMHKQALGVLRDIVRSHGRATTSVQERCVAGVEFVSRLGFRETGRSSGVISYELRGVNHGV